MAAPLANDDFRRLWMANILWWQTLWMEQIIIGWVVLELTNSAGQVALVGFYRMAPFLLFGPFISTVAARFSYRRIIIFSQFINVSLFAVLSLLVLSDLLEFWHLAVGSVLIGIGSAYDWSSRRALIPDLVGKERTVDAMVLENIPQNISRVAGPFLSGLILEFMGVKGGFPLLFGMYVVELWILSRMADVSDASDRPEGGSSWADLKDGYRYIREREPIMGVLWITLFMNAFTFPYQTLLPVFARDILHRGPIDLGILGACVGVGSFIGIVPVNWLKRYRRNGWVFAGSSLIGSAAIVGFALSTSYPLSLLLLVIAGIGQSGFSVMQSSIILQTATDAMRARMIGALALAIGGGPLGRLQIGGLATVLGSPFALALSAGAAVLGIAGTLMRLAGFRGKDEAG